MENIMLESSSEPLVVKLIDFGLSKVSGSVGSTGLLHRRMLRWRFVPLEQGFQEVLPILCVHLLLVSGLVANMCTITVEQNK